ncbi:hypothetical protein KAT82_01785, partial [bacterium]|nr:hypothetical protein [bacterium]
MRERTHLRWGGGGSNATGVDSVYTLEEKLYLTSPVFVRNALGKLLRDRFGPDYDRLNRFFRESERSDTTQIRAIQEERLSLVVSHAYETVPHCRRLTDGLGLKPSDLTRVEDLPTPPVLTKDVIRANLDDLISTAVDRRRIRKVSTSGTTGDAVSFYWDRAVDVVNNACLWCGRRWAGFEFGELYATLLGKMITAPKRKSPPFWRFKRGWDQMLMSLHHPTLDNIPCYIGALRDSGVVALRAAGPGAAADGGEG